MVTSVDYCVKLAIMEESGIWGFMHLVLVLADTVRMDSLRQQGFKRFAEFVFQE